MTHSLGCLEKTIKGNLQHNLKAKNRLTAMQKISLNLAFLVISFPSSKNKKKNSAPVLETSLFAGLEETVGVLIENILLY